MAQFNNPPPPNNKLSPYSGWDKAHYQYTGIEILRPLFKKITSLQDHFVFPDKNKVVYEADRYNEEMEGLCRTFLLASHLIALDPDLVIEKIPVGKYYQTQLAKRLNPKSRHYLGKQMPLLKKTPKISSHLIIEASALVIGLWFSRDVFWERFPLDLKIWVLDYFLDLQSIQTLLNNHRFFSVIIETFLVQEGVSVPKPKMGSQLDHLMAMYVGDGWYRDWNSFDYYSIWAFHFYFCIWSHFFLERNIIPPFLKDIRYIITPI